MEVLSRMPTIPNTISRLALVLAAFAALATTAIRTHAQTASWTSAGNMATARAGHTATLLQDGTVLVAGGNSVSYTITDTAEIYDPNSNTWTATGSMSTPRWGHSATLLPNGKVLVAGGYNGPLMNSAEIYDPVSRTWSSTGSMNTARSGHSATLLPNGMVLVAGGCCGTFPSELTSSELWNPATGAWTASGNMVAAHSGQTAALLSDGTVMAAAGAFAEMAGSMAGTTAVDQYQPFTGMWTAAASLSQGRAAFAGGLLAGDHMIVAGGISGGCCVGIGAMTSTEMYDPSTHTWLVMPSMANARSGLAGAAIANGTEFLVAGGGSLYMTSATAEVFDLTSQTWSTTASMSQTRLTFTMTTLADGTVLAVGGALYGGTPFTSAERYHPGAPPQTVSIAIASSASGAAVSVSGTGCSGGSYSVPASLTWIVGSSCTVSVTPPPGSTFASWSDGSTANPRTFVAPASAATYSFTMNAAPGPASIVASGGTPRNTPAGQPFASPLMATVRDASGNPVSGVVVTFTAPGSGASGSFAGGVKTAVTNAAGVATSAVFTANSKVGSYSVTAKVPGVSAAASFALTNTGGAPASIRVNDGNSQSATINTAFSDPLSVTVKDAGGNPVGGVLVTFTAPASGASGSFAGGANTAMTNSSGVATSATFTANGTAGSYTVAASVAGVSRTANFSLTNKSTGGGRHHGN